MEKINYIKNAFNSLRVNNIIRTQKDFANALGVTEAQISKALKGDERHLTDNLIEKVKLLVEQNGTPVPLDTISMFPQLDSHSTTTIPVVPTGARAGTLGDFAADGCKEYECERMISPIKGADYAIQVAGDSMAPEYPNGSQIIIKQVNESAFIEWGKVYVLDTDNGAIIKQIRKTQDPNIVECISVNKDYQPFTIDVRYIKGWYRVLMCLSLK